MNWDVLFKYIYKALVISYLVLWSLEINNNQEKYLNTFKDSLLYIQT